MHHHHILGDPVSAAYSRGERTVYRSLSYLDRHSLSNFLVDERQEGAKAERAMAHRMARKSAAVCLAAGAAGAAAVAVAAAAGT